MLLAEVKNPSGIRLTQSDTDGVWLHFEVHGIDAGGIRIDHPACILRNEWAKLQLKAATVTAEDAKCMTPKQTDELMRDIRDGVSMIVACDHYHDLETRANPEARLQITAGDVNFTFTQLQQKTRDRLNEKGAGIIISRHEMLGLIAEEYHELTRAVESGSLADVEDELVDITVAGVVSLASLKRGGVQW